MSRDKLIPFTFRFAGERYRILSGVLALIWGLFACSGTTVSGDVISVEGLKGFKNVENMTSLYFDRAMGYRESRFKAVSLRELFSEGSLAADGILLDCFDDYQGFISMEDIRNYDLRLATEIVIAPEFEKPGWLNPMLILVPDGMDAPKQESFMTANIRELRFVRSKDYYAPLEEAARRSDSSREGYFAFRKNCLFCHSLKGVGGNKGIDLPTTYDFAQTAERKRFISDFLGFHHKDNPDKQNMEQFVNQKKLNEIAEFLSAFL